MTKNPQYDHLIYVGGNGQRNRCNHNAALYVAEVNPDALYCEGKLLTRVQHEDGTWGDWIEMEHAFAFDPKTRTIIEVSPIENGETRTKLPDGTWGDWEKMPPAEHRYVISFKQTRKRLMKTKWGLDYASASKTTFESSDDAMNINPSVALR